VTKDEEKAEVLNAFFASVFNNKGNCSPDTHAPEQEDRDEEQKETPESKGKRSVTCYATHTHTSLWGQMGSTQGH